MNFFDRVGRIATVLVFGFAVGRAVADYNVTGYMQSFGTIALPATFSGMANATTLQLAERSFLFTPSQSGTYQTKFTFLKGTGSSDLSCKCTMTPTGTTPTLITTDGSEISFQAGKRYSFAFQAASGDVSGTGYARGTTSSGVATGYYKFVVTIGSSSPAPTTTYTITYKPGSYGTGSLQTATKTKGQSLTLKGAIFTRLGYTQKGWSTSTDGTSKAYELGGSYTTDAAVTLYPYWEANAASDLTFYQPSGWKDKLIISTATGTSTDGASFTTGDKLYLDFSVKNVGSAFSSSIYVDIYVDGTKVDYWPYAAGLDSGEYCTWTDKPIGPLTAGSHTVKLQIRNDANETVTSNNTYSRTITVDEEVDSVMVTFDANGGYLADSVTTASSMYDRTARFGQMETPQKSGYTFAGWFTQKSGGTQIYSTTTVSSAVGSSATSVTLYAHWTATITLSSISISGTTSVASGGTATFVCRASYSNGTTQNVTPTWAIYPSSSYASISSSGVLTASKVSSEQTVTVKAIYAEGGVTKTTTQSVTIQAEEGDLVCGQGATSFGTRTMPFVVTGTYGDNGATSFSFVAGASGTYKVWLYSTTAQNSYLQANLFGNSLGADFSLVDTQTFSFVKGQVYNVTLSRGMYNSTRSSGDMPFKMQFGGTEPTIPFIATPNVSATLVGSDVLVTWNAVSGAKKYHVFRDYDCPKTGFPYFGSEIEVVESETCSIVDENPWSVVSGNECWYYVYAEGEEVSSSMSDQSNVICYTPTPSPGVALKISHGWTWFSVNVTPDDASFATVFNGVAFADEDMIKSSDGSATYYGGKWYPSPATFKLVPGRAYAVKKSTTGTATVTVSGSAAPTSLAVEKGWNWIGVTSSAEVQLGNLSHSAGFADDDIINSSSGSATYSSGKWWPSSSGFTLVPGVGYKAKFAKAGTINFNK